MSRPIVVIVCISSSSESWEPYRRPDLWHSRAGGGAVHSINNGSGRFSCWDDGARASAVPWRLDRVRILTSMNGRAAERLRFALRGALAYYPVAVTRGR